MRFNSFPSNSGFVIVSQDGWWLGCNFSVILHTLDAIKQEFEKAFGSDLINDRHVTIVYSQEEFPCSWPNNNFIALIANDASGLQHAYQFSHEFCHCVIKTAVNSWWQWLDETLCALASFYFIEHAAPSLRIIREQFTPNNSVDSVLDVLEYIKGARSKSIAFPIDQLSKSSALLASFQKTPYQRERNAHIANMLLPIFEKYNYMWRATLFISRTPFTSNITEKFIYWKNEAPDEYEEGIVSFARVFGVKL